MEEERIVRIERETPRRVFRGDRAGGLTVTRPARAAVAAKRLRFEEALAFELQPGRRSRLLGGHEGAIARPMALAVKD